MKKFLYLMAVAALALGMTACEKDPSGDENQKEEEVTFPIVKAADEYLDASPLGTPAESDDANQLLSLTIEAEGAWKVVPLEEYDWIEAVPAEGEGNAEIVFATQENTTGKERSAEFEIKETMMGSDGVTTKDITIYNVFVSQKKKESNLGDGTLAFLQAIVEGNMLGENTPEVDNWYNVDEQFPGISLVGVDGGKMEIAQIGGSYLTGLPEVMELPELNHISVRGAQLNCMLPKVWNTPKLEFLNMACCNLFGPIPEGLASTTPRLIQIFLDQNNLYGALPHEWAAGINTLEVAIINNHANKNTDTEYYDSKDNSALGYLVPKQLDVRMNNIGEDGTNLNGSDGSHKQGDYTQMKLGGVFEGNYLGYEAGWGQHRAEAAGESVDEFTWTIFRTLWDSPAGHSNMGYEDKMQAIPAIMMSWDQAAADAWTKEAATLNQSRKFPKLGSTAN